MTFYQGNSREAVRATLLQKKRQQQQEDIEIKKKKIEEENKMTSIDNKFKAHYDAVEQLLRTDTIGLVTLEDMKKKRELIIQQREQQLARERKAKLDEEIARKQKKEKQKSEIQKLSFAQDLDEEEVDESDDDDGDDDDENKKGNEIDDDENKAITEATPKETSSSDTDNTESSNSNDTAANADKEKATNDDENNQSSATTSEAAEAAATATAAAVAKSEAAKIAKAKAEATTKAASEAAVVAATALALNKRRFGKNPNVDTSFLPDKDREIEENLLREKLRQEWVEKQEKLKNEEVEIVYSYWDGSGHRRTTKLKKGNSIQQFLFKCLENLRKENQFNELKVTSVDQMMYVKEDLILPHHYTFYDLIVTKARGKSGPLFLFDCHDDVRLTNDASVEKEESHAGKVILRSWYERHKHIFPASRWEPFDPEKKWDKPYTIKDKGLASA